jgi:hypothetical protein
MDGRDDDGSASANTIEEKLEREVEGAAGVSLNFVKMCELLCLVLLLKGIDR